MVIISYNQRAASAIAMVSAIERYVVAEPLSSTSKMSSDSDGVEMGVVWGFCVPNSVGVADGSSTVELEEWVVGISVALLCCDGELEVRMGSAAWRGTGQGQAMDLALRRMDTSVLAETTVIDQYQFIHLLLVYMCAQAYSF